MRAVLGVGEERGREGEEKGREGEREEGRARGEEGKEWKGRGKRKGTTHNGMQQGGNLKLGLAGELVDLATVVLPLR